ncbi:hypothetical protein WQE_34646 [Paraburkholderia hospita]|uniref:Uncharacterized protein n=1 Tax=Paraburkholderia hospita TaxID=169430 RepID=A0ABN0FCA1_9BURK|nr:hypothetical protein WQE_34646 [Paraburkholderia hospita]OUL80003.1 hypothetical protein CA602_28400 [Paraburkholderia hospita]
MSDASSLRDDSVRHLVPGDAVILSAGLRANDVFTKTHPCTPARLQVKVIIESMYLHIAYEANGVRIDWVADLGDPEIWKAIDSWKKHGTVFLALVDDFRDHLVKVPFIAAQWDIPRPDFTNFHISDPRIFDTFLEADIGAVDYAEREFMEDEANRNHRYFSANLLHTATLDANCHFFERLKANPLMNAAPTLNIRGTTTNSCMRDIRMRAEQTSRGHLVYPQQLPDEIASRIKEPFCLCAALPTTNENRNDLFLTNWVEVHGSYDHARQQLEATMYINRVEIDFDDDGTPGFENGTGERFPVLLLGEHGWSLMIYSWNQEQMNPPTDDDFFWVSRACVL